MGIRDPIQTAQYEVDAVSNVQKFFDRRPLVKEGTWLEVAEWCFGCSWIPIKTQYDKVCAHYDADALRHGSSWAVPNDQLNRAADPPQRSRVDAEREEIVQNLTQPPTELQSHIRQPGRSLSVQDLPQMSEEDVNQMEETYHQPPDTLPEDTLPEETLPGISSTDDMFNMSRPCQQQPSPKPSPQKRAPTPLPAATKKKKSRIQAERAAVSAEDSKVRFMYIAGIAGKMSSLTRCKYLVYWVPSDCAQGEPTITWETAAKLNKYTPETVDYTLSGLRIPIKEGSILRVDTDKYGVLDAIVRNFTKRNNTAICDLAYTQDSDETKAVNLLANYKDLLFVRSGAKYKIKEWSLVI